MKEWKKEEEEELTHAVLVGVSKSSLGIAVTLLEVVAGLVYNVDGSDGLDITSRVVVGLESGEGFLAGLESCGTGAGSEGHDGGEGGSELHLVWKIGSRDLGRNP